MIEEGEKTLTSYKDLIEELTKNEKIQERKNITININIKEIKEINIQDFKLDELSYRLDHLDIKDLNGALNLGNNFGGRVISGNKDPKDKATFSVNVNGKKVPFQVTEYYT
jgi:hypothetical protein